jgi:hypothetical protein
VITIKLRHPEQTTVEFMTKGFADSPDYKLHSSVFLPGAEAGTGELVLFLEERTTFNALPFKPMKLYETKGIAS